METEKKKNNDDILLELKCINAGYNSGQPILRNFNLKVCKGEKIAILGQNGVGKSTIGKLIMGLVPWFDGSVVFEGREIDNIGVSDRINLGIGYFYQGGKVFPNLSVLENLMIASFYKDLVTFKRKVEQVSLDFEVLRKKNLLNKKAGNLSGGERHQLALVMVILSVPQIKLLIADEPSAGLTSNNSFQTEGIINSFVSENNSALILIEQNLKLAKSITTNIITL